MANLIDMWKRYGAGVGIEIRDDALIAVAVRSRPSGVSVLGVLRVEGFRDRPAAEWGRDYAAMLREHGLSHVSATVCLPREEIVVRQLRLPPMPEKERAAAVRYQIDSLHPYGDEEVCFASATVQDGGKDRPSTLAVAIARRERIDHWANLFEEASIAVASFTVGEATLSTALRMRAEPAPQPLLVVEADDDALHVYGESSARPLLSAEFPLRSVPPARGLGLAVSDLRLGADERVGLTFFGSAAAEAAGELASASPALESRAVEEVFPAPLSAPSGFEIRDQLRGYAVGLEAACPRVGWQANLLPVERRTADSRWRWAPTAALVFLLTLLGVGYMVRPWVQNKAYADALRERIAVYEEAVAKVRDAKMNAEDARRRLEILRGLGERTRRDLAILNELSQRVPNSAWLTQLQIDDDGVRLNGEAQNAADLLRVLNESQTVGKARFTTSLRKIDEGESFQIAAERTAVPIASAPAAAAPPPSSAPAAAPAPVPAVESAPPAAQGGAEE